MPKPQIRLARRAEAEDIAAFQIAMARETEALELDPGTVLAGVCAVLSDPGRGEYRVASLDGELVGCLLITREWSDWRNGWVLWLQSVYVAPEHRGTGLFRRMYEDLRRRVESTPELKGIRLYVDRRNTHASRVYEALGMSREHYELFEWLT